MWFGLSSYRCGLFGLTDLETSKFRSYVTRDTKWSQQWRKIINFSHWCFLAFKMTFRNFFGLFWFLWPCWCLLRPLKSKRFNFYQITHLWNFWTNLAQSSHSGIVSYHVFDRWGGFSTSGNNLSGLGSGPKEISSLLNTDQTCHWLHWRKVDCWTLP